MKLQVTFHVGQRLHKTKETLLASMVANRRDEHTRRTTAVQRQPPRSNMVGEGRRSALWLEVVGWGQYPWFSVKAKIHQQC